MTPETKARLERWLSGERRLEAFADFRVGYESWSAQTFLDDGHAWSPIGNGGRGFTADEAINAALDEAGAE